MNNKEDQTKAEEGATNQSKQIINGEYL